MTTPDLVPHTAQHARAHPRLARGAVIGSLVAMLTGVAGCGSDATTAQAGNAVAIKGFAFSPGNLSVKAGTAATFSNQDTTTHTVTADDASFDSKNLDPGKSYTFTFSKPGTFKYHCDIHSYMTATVTVTG